MFHLNQALSKMHSTDSTAGNPLANRLMENPLFNVLVLEADSSYVCIFFKIAKILCLSNEEMRVYWILLSPSLPKKLSHLCPGTGTT